MFLVSKGKDNNEALSVNAEVNRSMGNCCVPIGVVGVGGGIVLTVLSAVDEAPIFCIDADRTGYTEEVTIGITGVGY